LLGAFAGVFAAAIFTPDTRINGRRLILGHVGYDKYTVNLPVMRGRLLDLFSRLLVVTRLGPWIRRKLLNANDVLIIRELAAQTSLPPLQHPMVRLSDEEWSQMKVWSEIRGTKLLDHSHSP
jgi:hypothetical protein